MTSINQLRKLHFKSETFPFEIQYKAHLDFQVQSLILKVHFWVHKSVQYWKTSLSKGHKSDRRRAIYLERNVMWPIVLPILQISQF